MFKLFRVAGFALILGFAIVALYSLAKRTDGPGMNSEMQLTNAPYGHILTNAAVWSPDSNWIVYDTRSDAAGEQFDGTRIEAVNIQTREVRVLYESKNGAHCGVASWHPKEMQIAFILGPENPTQDWSYAAMRRQGIIVDFNTPKQSRNLDARNLVAPYTPGALRGGSHVHMWHPIGDRLSFTYDDHVLAASVLRNSEKNRRTIGVSIANKAVNVPKTHPRNHDGSMFSAIVADTTSQPRLGSDDIISAYEEAWIGERGYAKPDGTWQKYALAFQGLVTSANAQTVPEVYVLDLPDDLAQAGSGTPQTMPTPPRGTAQRRLTFTENTKYPGLHGPRHWLRSSPDGSRIGFLRKDDDGDVQFWTVSPNGGTATASTRSTLPITSCFTWNPAGTKVAIVVDKSVCVIDASNGKMLRLTKPSDDASAPRPEACVFSPDGKWIAYIRRQQSQNEWFNQIFIVAVP